MANKPALDEIQFQSQLDGPALDYYKSLLPNMHMLFPVDLNHDDDINTSNILNNDAAKLCNYNNLNPNHVTLHHRNSLNPTNKHKIVSTPNRQTNQPQIIRTGTAFQTNQKRKPLKHPTARSNLVEISHLSNATLVECSNATCIRFASDIIADGIKSPHLDPAAECKEEWMINLQLYTKKHTQVFAAKKRENIDDENMFKHDINQNIGCFMKYIVPKLKEFHSTHFVYCNLKPSNIFMDFDIDPHQPLCFGLNSCVKCYRNYTRLLDIDSCAKYIGNVTNVGYNPPEIFVNDKTNVFIQPSFDVWCLGITLLQMIAGDHPFLYDLSMEYGKDNVMNGALENVINQAYIDEIVKFDPVLIRNKHKLFRDLLLQMLKVNVEERYTIDEIINHKWYQKNCI